MKVMRRKGGWRGLAAGLAGGLLLLLIGDRGAQTAPPTGIGIDPFEVLDLQVKNNVLIVLDTSGSMKFATDEDDFPVGADDPASRMFQLKEAVKAVVNANQTKVNLGLATYNILASQKTVLRDADDDNDGGRPDGPFIYVSADGAAANFYINHSNLDDGSTGTNEACNNVDGFFCNPSATFANYDGTNDGDVWRSFGNRNGGNNSAFDDPYPNNCTVGAGQLSPVIPTLRSAPANPAGSGMRCRYYLQSRLMRNNVRYTWDRASNNITTRLTATATPIPGGCPAPPPGLVGYAVPSMCFQFVDPSIGGPPAGQISTFYYTSAAFQQVAGTNSCGGAALLNQVSPCAGNNAPPILTAMEPELPVCSAVGPGCTAVGTLKGVPAAPGNATFDFGDGHFDGDNVAAADFGGLRAGQSTPLAGSLNFVRTTATPAFPPAGAPNQKNFVILLTDGDDTCASGGTADRRAVQAAAEAEALYANTADFVHNAETLMVAFTASVNPARVNVIAQAGSGRDIDQAAATPALALQNRPCLPGGACRDAFIATNTQELIDVLNAAIDQAAASGLFSATPSVFDVVPEFVSRVATSDFNDDPRTAYRAFFEAAGFRGRVRAFQTAGAVAGWEAGQSLMDRLSRDIIATDPAFVPHTFRGLMDPPTPPVPPGGFDHINRRIFTSSRNGITPGRVNLWPPPLTVAPTALTPGVLDEPLLRKFDGTAMTFADMQAAPLKACLGTNLAATACTASPLAAATKEAREMILAFVAGAEAQRNGAGEPLRDAAGQILYQARSWLLSESTLATPAVSVVPLDTAPNIHVPEYQLYTKGATLAGVPVDRVDQGFGLRKFTPFSMSVVYVPTNDLLHAFRAGPSCAVAAPPGAPSGCAEMGGQEMWAYVPFDLLPKLKDRMKAQSRRDHTFMMGSSIRFADIFVPGDFVESGVTYTGKWRRVLLAGRGIGGKHYTSLDITAPGHFTRTALSTNLPEVLWNRGNPDTANGLVTGARNGTAQEETLFGRMGQTWSTPVISRVEPAVGGKEFVAFVGSGYGVNFNPVTKVYDPLVGHGTELLTLDPLTGSVLDSVNVGGLAGTPPAPNALVANPVHFAPQLLNAVQSGGFANPVGVAAKSWFIGDLHGRMWKVHTTDPGNGVEFFAAGAEQPIAVPAALHAGLDGVSGASVYWETGYDARVIPGPPFKLFGVRDNGDTATSTGLLRTGSPGFPIDLPIATGTKGPFRGTLQPLTALNTLGTPLVFFVATRFNPITGTSCVSSFDTIIFGMNASNTGTVPGVVYQQTVDNVRAVGVPRPPIDGAASLDHGHPTAPGTEPPTPLPYDVPPQAGGGTVVVTTLVLRNQSPVCH